MSKGILSIAVLQVESDYFKDKDYRLSIKSDDSVYTYFVGKDNQSVSFGKNYQLYPLTNNLEVKLFQNQSDSRHGFFSIPMAKLYQLPKKHHLINVKCIWVEKADGKMSEDISATVKLSVFYHDTTKGHLQIHVKQAKLERDTELIGKMDPYLICKVGTIQTTTNILQDAGKNPKWNERFTYDLQSIPSKISFQVLDKDLTSSDIVGTIELNPQQDGFLILTQNQVERTIQINHEGQRAGQIIISTHFKLVN